MRTFYFSSVDVVKLKLPPHSIRFKQQFHCQNNTLFCQLLRANLAGGSYRDDANTGSAFILLNMYFIKKQNIKV